MLKIASAVLFAAISSLSFSDDSLYVTYCAQCHQKSGDGLAGQFPRLSGRFIAAEDSALLRDYMIKVLMYGQAGRMVVDGQAIIGEMPAQGLSDEELASVLDTVAQLGVDTNSKPGIFSLNEIAQVRAAGKMTPAELSTLRKQLVSEKILP